MTQEELERELIDLKRYALPPSDPVALLRLENRIYDLEQENKELKAALASVSAEGEAKPEPRMAYCSECGCNREVRLRDEVAENGVPFMDLVCNSCHWIIESFPGNG